MWYQQLTMGEGFLVIAGLVCEDDTAWSENRRAVEVEVEIALIGAEGDSAEISM
ncbi:hypothetical protein MXD61_15075 [Frankia sp. AgPm24]|nr:hypothetical protein [Frankia sp. AgPm24]